MPVNIGDFSRDRSLEHFESIDPYRFCGNALQASSNAFLMSTHRQFPPFVRADDAKPLLRG